MAREGDGLEDLLPPVAAWFRATFDTPTPPQRLGWPAIAAGQNTLIFAPTGSGKTLAAFLACLDHLWRVPRRARGVRDWSDQRRGVRSLDRDPGFGAAGAADASARG